MYGGICGSIQVNSRADFSYYGKQPCQEVSEIEETMVSIVALDGDYRRCGVTRKDRHRFTA